MRILFVCTQNRCRSIIAEAVANRFGEGRIIAASAGSEPAQKVHPETLKLLKSHGISTAGLACKCWDDMQTFEPDFVITLCDKAAHESCPIWFGMSLRVHWGLADPAKAEGSEAQKWAAFEDTYKILHNRIKKLARLLESDPSRTDIYDLLRTLAAEI